MALRDLLVKLRIKVDRKQVDSVQKKVDAVKASAKKATPIKISTRTASKDINVLQRKIAAFRVKVGLVAFALGGFGFGLGKVFDRVLDSADKIGKSAASLGLATDELQVLKQFAEESGSSMGSATNSLRRLSRGLEKAASTGKGPAADAFRELGIEIDGTENAMDLLFEAGGKIGELEAPAKRVQLAFTLFGRAGTELLPGFKNGAAAALDQKKALEELAVVYDKDFIASVEEANDAISRAKLQVTRLGTALVRDFLPTIKAVSALVQPLIQSFAKWAEQIDFTSVGLVAVVAGIKLASGVVGPLGVLFAGLVKTMLRIVLPALILEDLFQTMLGGDTVTRRLLDSLLGVGETAKIVEGLGDAWQYVVDWVKILWGLLTGESASQEVIKRFNSATEEIRALFRFLWQDIVDGAGAAGRAILKALTPGFLQDALGSIGGFLGSATSPVAKLGSSAANSSTVQNSGNTVVNISADVSDPVAVGRAVTGAVPPARDNRALLGLP